jgi:TolB-like protein/tetratricopeptide (TPR) repeat protein
MSAPESTNSDFDVSAEDVQGELATILASPPFTRGERMSRFLRFVVEQTLQGRGKDLKEYVIGTEVFGRDESFDPQTDSVVRGGARRLRAMLAEFYASDSGSRPVRIELTKGSYAPVFRPTQPEEPVIQETAATLRPVREISRTLVAVMLVAGCVTAAIAFRSKSSAKAVSSVAVLPFRDLSPQGNQSYLCEGITEELIYVLSKTGNVHVAARESSFRAGGENSDVIASGQKLAVEAVIHGSVQTIQERLRVWVRVVDVASGEHLLSESYEREMNDIFALQDEIAQSVVQVLKTDSPSGLFSPHPPTRNLEAYKLFLLGQQHSRRVNPADMDIARGHLEKAVQIDPQFSLAYARLADVYTYWSADPVRRGEFAVRANEAAQRALQLDGNSSEAHLALAQQQTFQWSWATAEAGFLRALQLDPRNARAHSYYGLQYLLPRGRLKEALVHVRRAMELDPLSPYVSREAGWAFYLARDYDAAIRALQTARELDSRMFAALHLGKTYIALKRYAEAAAECKWPVRPDPVCVAIAYAGMGRKAEAEGLIARVQKDQELRHRRPDRIAEYYAFTNQKEQAFRWLEEGIRTQSPLLPLAIQAEPLYDNLRSDQRFAGLLRKVWLQRP